MQYQKSKMTTENLIQTDGSWLQPSDLLTRLTLILQRPSRNKSYIFLIRNLSLDVNKILYQGILVKPNFCLELSFIHINFAYSYK